MSARSRGAPTTSTSRTSSAALQPSRSLERSLRASIRSSTLPTGLWPCSGAARRPISRRLGAQTPPRHGAMPSSRGPAPTRRGASRQLPVRQPSTSSFSRTASWAAESWSQWAGQLVLVEQALDADATVVQTGTRRSRLVGGTAGAFATAADLALIDQFAANRPPGSRDRLQAILQAAYAAQDASAHGATTQQAGAAALPAALSEAEALNRAAMVQDAVQSSSASDALDVQDISQTSIVVQQADASSVSFGGIAGPAAVLNCGVTHQAAAQSIGPAATLPRTDPSPFCSPAAPPQGSSPVASALSIATGGEPLAASGLPSATALAAAAAGGEEETSFVRGSRDAAAARAQPRRAAPTAGARSARPPVRLEPAPSRIHGFSALHHSTQARLDTRPRSHAGTGDADREPPLPPAGDPPRWVSALAAAASTRRRALGDRSDPRGLRARAAASAAGARRVGRQAADRRPLTGRRPGLTFRHAT